MERVMRGASSKWKASWGVLKANGRGLGRCYIINANGMGIGRLREDEKGHGRCFKKMERV